MATHLNPVTGYAPYQSAQLSWVYDSFGNYVNEALSGSTSFSMPQPAPYTYTSANQIVGFNYDSAGNQTSDPVLGPNTYVYDAENRVYSSGNGSTTYLYDAEGQRVAKVAGGVLTNQYLLGLDNEQVTELDGNSGWLHSNAYAAGKLLATYDNMGVHFQFSDWIGNRRVQADGLGNIEETCSNLPYGDNLFCSGPGTDATEHHFTGKERDTESGLDYFGARYYGSSIGRFMTPDWSSVPDSVPYADFNDPQTLNLYAYAGNNPISFADADGHTYHICDAQGQNCSDVSDNDFDQIIKNGRAAGEYWVDGKISLSDGTAAGSYKQTDVDLPGDPAANQAAANMIGNGGTGMVNLFLQNMAYSAAGGLIGQGIGLGIEALVDGAGIVNTGSTAVYQSVNATGEVQYIGQTTNFVARGAAHGSRFTIQRIPGLSNLSASDARAVEQVLIENHGLLKNGGTLLNKINSIASTNPSYAQALQRGMQILKQVGYFK